MASKKSNRSAYFTFVAYPDSVPDNWSDIIDNYHIAWVCSPLHDKDFNADGTPKKPHWHLMLAFDSVKAPEQAQMIANAVRGTLVQIAHSPRALVRYMIHMDNPEKAQYDKRDIRVHGGYDLQDYLTTGNISKYDTLKAILAYVVEADIVEYEDLVIYCMYNEQSWFEALADNCTYMVNSFIKSRRNRKDRDNT